MQEQRVNRTRWMIVTGALLLAAAPALVMAQPPGPHSGPHGFGPWALKALDLAPDQEESVKDLLESHRQSMEPRFQELHEARKSLDEAVHAEVFDEASIRQAAVAVNAIETDLAVERGLLFKSLRQVLTPEQVAELEGMRKAGRHLFGRRGPGGHHPHFKHPPQG